MIDACSTLYPGKFLNHCQNSIPLIHCLEAWRPALGHGVIAGLLDTGFDKSLSDLFGADLIVKDFVNTQEQYGDIDEHGTFSVALLVGQGRCQIRGIVPHARLLVAKVVDPYGIATPHTVTDAIDWLVSSGAQIVMIPLGETTDRQEIAEKIEESSKSGVVFFAAAGNGHPKPLFFPACNTNVIAIGAADLEGNLLPECSRWPRLDLVAPGLNIAAPVRNQVIRGGSGTSVACIVAGGAAILAISAGAIKGKSITKTNLLRALIYNNHFKEANYE